MRASEIKIGESYRLKRTPNYTYFKVQKVLRPNEGENPHNRIIVKGVQSTELNGAFGLIKYFRPSELVRI